MPTTGAHGIIIPDPSTSGAIINHVRDLAIQTENALNDVAAHVATGIGIENYATKTYVGNALGPYATKSYVDDALSGIDTSGPGVNIKVGGSQPASGWWLNDGSIGPTVTPAAPTFTDLSGTANDTYTIPNTPNVRYLVGGTTRNAGTYPASGTVTITAQGINGYTLTGYPAGGWSHTFSALTTVTPNAPTWTDNTEGGGGSWSASQTGVVYSPASGVATSGQTVTVTATPASGFVFPAGATTSWSHTFPEGPPPEPTILDTFTRTVATNSGGDIGTSDSGHTWTRVANGSVSVDGSKLHLNSSPAELAITDALTTWNVEIAFDVALVSGTPNQVQGPWVRFGDATNGVRVRSSGDGSLTVSQLSGGTLSTLATLPGTTTDRAVKFAVASNDGMNLTITVYENGTQVGDPVTATLAGALPKTVSVSITGGSPHTLDNFTVTEIV